MRNVKNAKNALTLPPWALVCLLCLLVSSEIGCSANSGPKRDHTFRFPDYGSKVQIDDTAQSSSRSYQLPWAAWQSFYDLKGQRLSRFEILQGDELSAKGNASAALEMYLKALSIPTLTLAEREAVSLRVASTQLALGQTTRALSTVSSFFRSQQKSANDVDINYSLFLGFAYAQAGDVDQSLAWYSRTHRLAKGEGGYEGSSRFGMNALLTSLPLENLNRLSQDWNNDAFVAGLLGQERRRRADGGQVMTYNPYEKGSKPPEYAVTTNTHGDATGLTVGVLLPLTGKFAALGTSTKNGIELALKADDPKGAPQVLFEDDQGDSTTVNAKARSLSEHSGMTLIMGPLLSELAGTVSEVVRETGVPLLTYSKKENFQTGEGIFRLGPTVSSQVSSLLAVCKDKMGLQRFGLVFPEDQNGQEFAALFRAETQRLGLELSFEASYPPSNLDSLLDVAAQVDSYNVQAIFLPDTLQAANRFFSSLSPVARERVIPLGPASWDNREQLTRSRTVLDGAIFVSPFFSLSQKPVVSQFVQTYEATYRSKPDFLAAQGFDSATLALAALKKHQEEGIPMRDAIGQIDVYEGLTGRIAVQSNGELQREFSVLQLKDGRIAEVVERIVSNFVYRGNEVVGHPEPQAQTKPGGF